MQNAFLQNYFLCLFRKKYVSHLSRRLTSPMSRRDPDPEGATADNPMTRQKHQSLDHCGPNRKSHMAWKGLIRRILKGLCCRLAFIKALARYSGNGHIRTVQSRDSVALLLWMSKHDSSNMFLFLITHDFQPTKGNLDVNLINILVVN